MRKKAFPSGVRFAGMGLLVLVLTALLIRGCNYLLVDDSQSYTRLMMHEFYETKEPIDTLFLGSSHCFRAYDPQLFTELTGKTAFNLGSSAQNYDTSYYLLREAAKNHDIKTVYLDMHYKFLFVGREDQDLVQANIISDYMRLSLNKLEFLTQTADVKQITNRFLPFRREWQKLADAPYLYDTFQKKQTKAYRNYEPVVLEKEYYVGKGFVYSEEKLDADAITWWENFTPVAEDMDSDETYTLSYIERIVEFCQEQEIRLIFVTAPCYERYLEEVGPYDLAYNYIKKMADSYGVLYLDFNLCKRAYLDLGEDSFLDVDHLNGKGAEELTSLLAELDSGQVDIDGYFNPCYDKKSLNR